MIVTVDESHYAPKSVYSPIVISLTLDAKSLWFMLGMLDLLKGRFEWLPCSMNLIFRKEKNVLWVWLLNQVACQGRIVVQAYRLSAYGVVGSGRGRRYLI